MRRALQVNPGVVRASCGDSGPSGATRTIMVIRWTNASRDGERFFVGEAGDALTTDVALRALFLAMQERILGEGNAAGFDRLMLEVCCDTGRLIVGASTEERWKGGATDGCSLRVQELQDYWYDQVDAGLADDDFVEAIRRRVEDIGLSFKALVDQSHPTLRAKAAQPGFKLLVFGSSSDAVLENQYV